MTKEQFIKLLQIIEAKINMHAAHNSSDGGLIEHIREIELIKEFEQDLKI